MISLTVGQFCSIFLIFFLSLFSILWLRSYCKFKYFHTQQNKDILRLFQKCKVCNFEYINREGTIFSHCPICGSINKKGGEDDN